jgi:hypothetical protein
MAYLDVSPMITALRASPDQFEITHGWLHHMPSRHNFRFGPEGNVTIEARCDCSFLAVRREQELELLDAFRHWQAGYWRPLQINREFASHFEPPSYFRRVLITLTDKLHRALLRQGHGHHRHEEIVVPAE